LNLGSIREIISMSISLISSIFAIIGTFTYYQTVKGTQNFSMSNNRLESDAQKPCGAEARRYKNRNLALLEDVPERS
jgi:hypothetical protein